MRLATFRLIPAWVAFILLVAFGGLSAAAKPNILLVLLDDSGWTDFGCYGSRIDTPNIDRLASQGMRFTDCHSAAPNCSPSRVGLLTGRTPSRAGVYSYLPPDHVMHLSESEVTVAEILKRQGYATGHFGKWHVTNLDSDQPQPKDHGFDHSLGTDNNASPSHKDPVNFIRNGKPVGKVEGYSCQIVVDETMGWLAERERGDDEQPWLACAWFHEPHTPIASPLDLVRKYEERFPKLSRKHATYYANIENVDRAVGRLLKMLDEAGETDETFVFLTSDNGPLNEFSKVGLRGRKSHVWEGGHRVPGIFRWPGKIAPGATNQTPISGVDFLPTVCEVVGADLPPNRVLDGTSILPLLRGGAFERERPLFWFFYRVEPAAAMRVGDWVMVAQMDDNRRKKTHPLTAPDMPAIKRDGLTGFELYNLKRDLAQTSELGGIEVERFNRMKQRLIAYHKEVVEEGVYWEIPENYGKKKTKKK